MIIDESWIEVFEVSVLTCKYPSTEPSVLQYLSVRTRVQAGKYRHGVEVLWPFSCVGIG